MRSDVFRRDRFRALLQERNLSQAQLAGMVGMDQASIAAYLRARQPTLPVLCEIADALKVSADYLIGRSDNPTETFMTNDEKLSRDALLFVEALRNKEFLKLIRMAVEQAEKDGGIAGNNGVQ